MMKKYKALLILLSLITFGNTIYAQEIWEQVVEGVFEGRRVDLFMKSTEHAFPCFCDLDGDGDHDLLMGGYEGVRLYRNDGNDKFPKWTFFSENIFQMPVSEAYHIMDPDVADFDADGDLDVVLTSYSDDTYLYRNDGDLSFTQISSNFIPIGGNNLSVATGDLNDDGLTDLIIGLNPGHVYYSENVGNSTTPSFVSTVELTIDIEGQSFPIPDLCDIDGDGDLDLFLSTADNPTYTPKMFLFLNTGNRTNPEFTKFTNTFFPSITDCWIHFDFYDYQEDGDLDCILMDGQTGFYGFMKNSGTLSVPQWEITRNVFQILAYKGISENVALGDIDGDGDLDMLQAGRDGAYDWVLGFYENVGTPTSPNWKFITKDYLATYQKGKRPVFCDIDQDNDLDLFLGGKNSYGNAGILYYRNDGNHQNPSWTYVTDQWQGISVSEQALPCFGDLNGDGLSDLLLGYKTSSTPLPTVRYYVNQGTLGNPHYPSYVDLVNPVYPPITNNWCLCSPALADVDNDGDLDLFVGVDSNPSGMERIGQINFFRNEGTITNPIFNALPEEEKWQDLDLKSVVILSSGDIDGDGSPNLFISDRDYGILQFACQNRTISISPPRTTIFPEETKTFTASGTIGATTWSIVENKSGCNLIPSGTSAYYTAGTNPGVDIIQINDASNAVGRAYANVISPASSSLTGKAIICAGRRSTTDPVWPATWNMARLAFQTLQHKGFSKDQIYLLSAVTGLDADGNGADDDIDAESTLYNLSSAIIGWASDADKLTLYLVDHGFEESGISRFHCNTGEENILSAASLGAMLNVLQEISDMEIITIVDSCKSGGFLPALTPPTGKERITITASTAGELTYFLGEGLISFSDAFWNGVLIGLTVGESFDNAAIAMNIYQTPQLDDNGDGTFDGDVDGLIADSSNIGLSITAGEDRPQIGNVVGNHVISGTNVLNLWAEVSSANTLQEVFTVIFPPTFQTDPETNDPVIDLPTQALSYNGTSDRWEGNYNSFDETGSYKIIFYARDIWNSVSFPKQVYIHRTDQTEQAVIAVGEGNYGAEQPQSNSESVGATVYEKLRGRWMGNNDIHYYSPATGLDGVDGAPTLAAIQSAITTSASGAPKLTVFLIGQGTTNNLKLSSTEDLTPILLDGWLDTLQSSSSTKVVVVVECEDSDTWADDLTPTSGQDRIIITSTTENKYSFCNQGGIFSFSQMFFTQVQLGENIRDSFLGSVPAIRFLTRDQQIPGLTDDGNGILNEKTDGPLAKTRFIGPGFLTGGDDIPTIGETAGEIYFWSGESSVELWAADVYDSDGIRCVTATIFPPRWPVDPLVELAMVFDASDSRYEATWSQFTESGDYRISYVAEDNEGNVSLQTYGAVYQYTYADAFEIDDSTAEASLVVVDDITREHNFHDLGDEDWCYFYAEFDASTPPTYTIKVLSPGPACDPVLTVVEDQPGAIPVKTDLGGAGEGETYLYGPASQNGKVFFKVHNYTPSATGANTEYFVQVIQEQGVSNGHVCDIGEDYLGLCWDASTDPNIQSYNIYRSTIPWLSNYPLIDNIPSTQTEYTDDNDGWGLDPSTTYYYRVEEVDTYYNSQQESSEFFETTLDPLDVPDWTNY